MSRNSRVFTTDDLKDVRIGKIYMSRNSRVFTTCEDKDTVDEVIYMSRNSRVFTTQNGCRLHLFWLALQPPQFTN